MEIPFDELNNILVDEKQHCCKYHYTLAIHRGDICKKFVILREIEFTQIIFGEVDETNNIQLRFELDLSGFHSVEILAFFTSRFHVKSECQENWQNSTLF